jgi:hypothetical protein
VARLFGEGEAIWRAQGRVPSRVAGVHRRR